MSKPLLVAVSIALLCMPQTGAQFTDSVVARVQDEIITAFRVYEESQRQERILRRELAGQELETTLAELRNHTATRLIEQELVYAEFQSLNVELPGNLVQQRLDRFVKEQAGGSRPAFETLLEEQGMTLREFKEKLERALAVELLVRERVTRNIDIGPAQVQEYFAAHRADFARPEQVRLETIVVRGADRTAEEREKLVAKVLAELAGGKPFGEVARAHSEDAFADQGGDRGWQETRRYGETLRGVLAELEVGTIRAEPFMMGDDAYIFRLAGRRGGGQAELDAATQEEIQDILARQEETIRYREFINGLRRKYFVRIFDHDLAEFWKSL